MSTSRRKFLMQATAAGMTGVAATNALAALTAGPERETRAYEGRCTDASIKIAAVSSPLKIPYPAKPWAQATRIVGYRHQLPLGPLKEKPPNYDRTPLYNDFCLTQSADGRWHCIGILFEGYSQDTFRQDRLFHYVADAIQGPYRSLGYLDLGYGQPDGVWAPCILRDGKRTLLYYAHQGSICVAQSEDPQLLQWRRGTSGKEVMFSEGGARDPEIIQDQRTGLYLMYYVCSAKVDGDWTGLVRVRTSRNLMAWSEPRTVLGTPPGYGGAESVFVLQENGVYYMWISGSMDYSAMSLYISADPFNFGDVVANRIEEQPGHAAEVVRADGRYWLGCVAIASVPGLDDLTQPHNLPVNQHDLEGVWIQPLEWRPATAEMKAKVVTVARQ